ASIDIDCVLRGLLAVPTLAQPTRPEKGARLGEESERYRGTPLQNGPTRLTAFPLRYDPSASITRRCLLYPAVLRLHPDQTRAAEGWQDRLPARGADHER